MNSKLTFNLKIALLLSFFLSYLFGFILRENIAGGARADFESFTWPLITAFKTNFFDTLINYGSYGEGSLPLFHIINAYLNPFSFDKFLFQASITIVSLLNVVFFSQIISHKYKVKKINSLLLSSIFLLLPFFRSSAFWGITENFGWLFLILSIKYYNIYENNSFKDKILNIFLVCFFSSLALYIRPYLVFFPLFVIIYSTIKKDFVLLKFSILFYIIFSIPGLYLISLWGNVIQTDSELINLSNNYHNPKFILKNLIIFFSIFLFYAMPFSFHNLKSNIFANQNLIFFIIVVFTVSLIYIFGYFDYLTLIDLGGGIFLKLNNLFFKDSLIFFLVLSSLGLVLISKYFLISKKNKIIFLCLIIFCFPKFIFQEYFEPLFLILLFSLFDLEKSKSKMFNQNEIILAFCSYFIVYLIGSFYFRYYIL